MQNLQGGVYVCSAWAVRIRKYHRGQNIALTKDSVSTLCALGLDFYVYRQQNRRGVYRLHDIDVKNRPAAVRGPFTDEDHRESATFDEPRYSEAFEAPREYTEPPRQMQGKGYAVPEGQFEYDTGYHGGHAERAFGSD